MKCGVIVYHKNIYDIYKKQWVDKCLQSLYNQKYDKDSIQIKWYELCYGDEYSLFSLKNEEHQYFLNPLVNHIQAMNWLLDIAFQECDIVFNTNLDDYYDEYRFQKQINLVKKGYSLISSNFSVVDENENLKRTCLFDKLNLKEEFDKNHNILGHPVICYTKDFWLRNRYYIDTELGYEDFTLWKKALNNNEKIIIHSDILFWYRTHDKQTGRWHQS